MKNVCKILIVLMLCTSIFSCANIKDDGQRTRTEGTLVGMGGGAAVGAGIGAIAGGGRGAAIGAAIGGLVGGVAGYFVGDHIADRKAEYASEEDWLDDCIAQTESLNKQAVAYNTKLKTDVAALDKKTVKLAADYKKNQASRDALMAEAKTIKDRRAEVAQNIEILQNEVNRQKTVSADARKSNNPKKAATLDAEIVKMEKQIASLKQYNEKLASISVRVAV